MINLKFFRHVFCFVIINVICCYQVINAQFTLEHTFEASDISTTTLTNFSNNIAMNVSYYTIYNKSTNQVKLYNEDYSLFKSITITPPTNYRIFGIGTGGTSNPVFVMNDKTTFFVTFMIENITDINTATNLRLYNEDGIIVKDFGYGASVTAVFHTTKKGLLRLAIIRDKAISASSPRTYETEIYSVEGINTTGSISIKSNENILFAYPNPANSTISLPYQLKQGEKSSINIFNLNGQLIETKQIDSNFDKILLNVSNYAKGMYLYEVNGISKKFIVN